MLWFSLGSPDSQDLLEQGPSWEISVHWGLRPKTLV